MLAVTFLFPMVLTAAGAAAAPVIIHLILRTKPRKVLFPAMRFVRKTHRANLSKLRLKHLILLLMRMGAIVLLALLLARAQWPRWTSVADTDVPTAAVVIVDNSASMAYVHRGKAVLARGKRLAGRVIEALPAGSRVAILPTHGARGKRSLLTDRQLVAEQLAAVQAGPGSRGIGASLARALAMLREADLPRKEVYVVTDMTAQGWRGLQRLPEGDARVIVLNCSRGEDANISLGAVRPAATAVPNGAEVALETVVRSAQVGGEIEVRVELAGRPVASRSVVLQPGAATPVTLTFRPDREGVAHGRVSFQQDDPLRIDNVRYFTLTVGPPARALLVRDPATVGRGDPTSFLMGHAIAALSSAGGRTRWLARETITADRLDASRLAGARFVLLTDVSSLAERQWRTLETYARGGGHVWIVIGSLVSAASYNTASARRVVPAALGEMETLAPPAAWRPEARGETMLQPFATGANPPLSEVRCTRRFRLSRLAAGAEVVLRYADDRPAIVRRAVGDGSAVLWNFSPVRGFSNLAGLAQFPVLAQRTARLLSAEIGERTMYLWGESATVSAPRAMGGAMVTVRRPGSPVERPVPRDARRGTVTFPADAPGAWTVQFAEAERRVLRGFSVNVDPAESDLTPADVEDLRLAIPSERLVVASGLADLAEHRRTVTQPLDLMVPLLLAVLVLMTGESYFANRFYRTDGPTAVVSG